MSKNIRRAVAKRLKDAIETATDPMVIAALAGQLAKFLPRPKSPRRKRGTPVAPIKTEGQTLTEMTVALEKKRKGLPLTTEEMKMVAAVDRTDSEVNQHRLLKMEKPKTLSRTSRSR
jgi:hypothetical protein